MGEGVKFNPFSYFLRRIMERRPDKHWVPCPDCKMQVDITWPIHVCTIWENGMRKSSTRKVWDPALNAWKVAPEEVKEKRLFDQEGRELSWKLKDKVIISMKQDEKGETAETSLQSCGIKKEKEEVVHAKTCICDACRPRDIKYHLGTCRCWDCWKWKNAKGAVTVSWTEWRASDPYYNKSNTYYFDVKPWAGVSATKWPNTFKFLMGQYYIGSRWYEGLTISSMEYEDRILRGVYAPEPVPYHKKVEKKEEKKSADDTEDEENFWERWSTYGDA